MRHLLCLTETTSPPTETPSSPLGELGVSLLLKNKNKIKAEADLPEVAEPIATNRRRESTAHLGACAS